MLNLMKQFVHEDDGLEMVEWAIVAALITTAAAVTMASIGTQVDAAYNTILTTLQAGWSENRVRRIPFASTGSLCHSVVRARCWIDTVAELESIDRLAFVTGSNGIGPRRVAVLQSGVGGPSRFSGRTPAGSSSDRPMATDA